MTDVVADDATSVSDSDEGSFDAVPTGAPRRSVIPKTLLQLYSNTKNLFSPLEKQKAAGAFPEIQETPHPGTEGVSFEEAIKQCPHLAEKYKHRGKEAAHDLGSQEGQSGSGSACPFRDGHEEAPSAAASRCPYKNDISSQEWPMRAVLMFIAYNVISAGVSIGVIKIAFVIGAYHMGMLRPSEFVTVYLATAAMSSYKLLGLMLMLTNRGGPSFSFNKQYHLSPLTILHSCIIIIGTFLVTGLSMRYAKWMDYFKEETQTDVMSFSIVDHIIIPTGAEFVFRGFLLKEMGRDLGSWFGVIGASGWFSMLKRGQASVKYAACVQGIFWSLYTKALQGNLMPVTLAHICVASTRALCPTIYFAFYPEGM